MASCHSPIPLENRLLLLLVAQLKEAPARKGSRGRRGSCIAKLGKVPLPPQPTPLKGGMELTWLVLASSFACASSVAFASSCNPQPTIEPVVVSSFGGFHPPFAAEDMLVETYNHLARILRDRTWWKRQTNVRTIWVAERSRTAAVPADPRPRAP
jgi:hypothetical protein